MSRETDRELSVLRFRLAQNIKERRELGDENRRLRIAIDQRKTELQGSPANE